MDWLQEAKKREKTILSELQELIAIPSVLSEEATPTAPFGKDVKQALDWFLQKGKTQGYTMKNVGDVAGHLEIGQGEELLGILGHVDVVPVGSGWTKEPFGGEIHEGRMYGRGAIDDKGPTIAAWTAVNMLKDAGVEFTKRVRLIIGTDEESEFRCMDRYFKTEEMPSVAFTPDADFPIINAEKGIASLVFSTFSMYDDAILESFIAGHRTNMVPDKATAILNSQLAEWQEDFKAFCKEHDVTGVVEQHNGSTELTLNGKSAHAMEPDDGINAGILLALFLKGRLEGDGQKFVAFVADMFYEDSRGHKLGLNYTDDQSGDTTFNAGIIRFEKKKTAMITVSMRYSISYPFETKVTAYELENFVLEIASNSPPHYVDGNDPFIKTLQSAYEKQTSDKAELIAIGGGTYARVLEKGVAFGMLFPGEPDVAHQADEFVDIDNLIKATAIYAEAIYQLACKK